MPARVWSPTLAGLGVAAFALLVLTWDSMFAQPPKPKAEGFGPPAQKPTPYLRSEKRCSTCHLERPKGYDDPLSCRCIEQTIWREHDKHQQAFAVLVKEGGLGQRMAGILGVDVRKKEAGCIGCHGIGAVPLGEIDTNFDPLAEGISCLVCHGAFKDWYPLHLDDAEYKKWRATPRSIKEQYGMTDLWDASKRVDLCASCHIGNIKEGKFVTHEMYAAGHPPLPSFEAMTFSEEMPRHWELQREKLTRPGLKANEQQELRQYLERDGFKEGDKEQTKLLMVSAAVSLRDYLRLLIDQFKTGENVSSDQALDFASFDCYACHHDLKSPSWRQQRPAIGKPGRPQMPEWPTALLDLAVEHVRAANPKAETPRKDWKAMLAKVAAGFDSRPLGDPDKIILAAKELAGWAEMLSVEINEAPCREEQACSAVQRLAAQYKTKTVDYDTARQIAWAMRGILRECGDPKADLPEGFDKLLQLKLPSGKDAKYEERLPALLKSLYDYDPNQFKKLLGSVEGPKTP